MKKEIEDLLKNYYENLSIINDDKCNFYAYIGINDKKLSVLKEGNKVKVEEIDGDKTLSGTAKCNKDDKFDFIKGLDIAFNRLTNKGYATENNFKKHLTFVDEDSTSVDGKSKWIIGTPTDLVDINGNELSVGDVVEVYWLDKPTSYRESGDTPNLTYVINYDYGVDEYENSTYVGCLSGYRVNSKRPGKDGILITKDKEAYIFRLVKKYDELTNGETYGNLKAVTVQNVKQTVDKDSTKPAANDKKALSEEDKNRLKALVKTYKSLIKSLEETELNTELANSYRERIKSIEAELLEECR